MWVERQQAEIMVLRGYWYLTGRYERRGHVMFWEIKPLMH